MIMRRRMCTAVWYALVSLSLLTPGARAQPAMSAARDSSRPVVVASKPFGESYLLAEMFAQLLEAHGIPVERRPGLGATDIAFAALRAGEIDVYPEYTGTGLLAILHESPVSDPQAVFDRVSREFERRYGVRWLPPLGFENNFAIAVRPETAARFHLKTLSDLARVGSRLVAGFSPDFLGRADGLPGLTRAYGLHLQAVRTLLPAVKYQALASKAVDVIDAYSTDGLIARYHLVVLEDDRGFFPPYQAAALVSARLQRDNPRAVAVLTQLSNRLDAARMRSLSERVEVGGEPVARVAASALRTLGLAAPASARAAGVRAPADTARVSFGAYLWGRRATLLALTQRHLLLVALSLAAAIVVAVPIGLLLERGRGSAAPVIRAVGLFQTIPSIALLAFMIPLLGIGVTPAIVALFLYSLFPILQNTYAGVRDASPDAVDAARALGMTPGQVLRLVRLPLSAPVIMAGIRTAAVIDVGTATLAAFIGAGGLGEPIVSGLALSDTRMILSGAIPAALLALVVDGVLGVVEWLVTPTPLRVRRGMRRRRGTPTADGSPAGAH
jgi:osmoprotectant transport system permease protein